MSKKPSQYQEALNIADEGVWELRCAREKLTWLSALTAAIKADLTTGKGCHALDLAALGKYLADDWANEVDVARESLEERAKGMEGNQ